MNRDRASHEEGAVARSHIAVGSVIALADAIVVFRELFGYTAKCSSRKSVYAAACDPPMTNLNTRDKIMRYLRRAPRDAIRRDGPGTGLHTRTYLTFR
ncbi:hypothetical protein AG1IA_06945 [Rhizoctonia solani AG-1 IA]|uniref:Uncharacterized protein n=1 Tax=Thanatephorus cucumeris (strain AG1-IA) TaxID=983506 RepID=L8WRL9_THACA|nr:hypothetical protein AG1IA_06945 [Rhizoctonia solani AG-1 IA]